MPPEESVPERRDLPPLPLPPLVNSQKEYPVPAKRLFVEDARENPPLPVVPRGEEALAGGAAEEEENAPDFHSARPDEAVFRLSHLAGEDEEAGSEGGEGDRVGLIPPRLRAFRRAQKSWRHQGSAAKDGEIRGKRGGRGHRRESEKARGRA